LLTLAVGRGRLNKDPPVRHKYFLILLLILNPIIGACAHSSQTTPAQVLLTKIRAGQQMPGTSKIPDAMWVSNENQLSDLLARLGKGTKIPAMPMDMPKIDFTEYGVLTVWMGQKPTGGYALELMAETAGIKNRAALVPIRWIEPKKGMLTTQIITHPFLMIRMAKGNYNTIAVMDQNGVVRMRIGVSEK